MTLAELVRLADEHLRAGRPDDAEHLYRQLVAEHPDNLNVLRLIALLTRQHQRDALAIEVLARAVAIAPHDADLQHDLANALADQGQFEQAISHYEQALSARPDWPEALNHLGVALAAQRRWDDAISRHRHVLSLRPDDPASHRFIADALAQQGNLEDAITTYRRALELDPSDPQTHNNHGAALVDAQRLDEAIACYRHALTLQPDSLAIRDNLSKALLTRGDLLEGWREHEARWRVAHNPSGALPPDVWDGRDPAGRTILLHAEQGFGDTIHFIRYAPVLAARGARVIVECQRELVRLLRNMDGVHEVIARGEPPPPFDLHAMLLSLPANFATTLETIPARVPYLPARAELSQPWSERLSNDPRRLKVGLSWAGNPRQKNDHNRSMPLSLLAPLALVPNVRFYSLQKGPAAGQQTDPAVAALRLIDHTAELTDFADTAALIEQLDLVITVDTAVAHLAGALGKPVWTLLTYAADWRYLLHRDDCPWYPTMRLFRQQTWGDWTGVVSRIASALISLPSESPRLRRGTPL